MIISAMLDGKCLLAALALAGNCDHLADGGGIVFAEKNQTTNLRVEVFDRSLVIPIISADQISASTVAGV
jgi:hypothetical protein